jgi:hypothetical protein
MTVRQPSWTAVLDNRHAANRAWAIGMGNRHGAIGHGAIAMIRVARRHDEWHAELCRRRLDPLCVNLQ